MMVAAAPVDAAVDSSAKHTQADPDSHTALYQLICIYVYMKYIGIRILMQIYCIL